MLLKKILYVVSRAGSTGWHTWTLRMVRSVEKVTLLLWLCILVKVFFNRGHDALNSIILCCDWRTRRVICGRRSATRLQLGNMASALFFLDLKGKVRM